MTRAAFLAPAVLAALLVGTLSLPARADFDRRAWAHYRDLPAAIVSEAYRSGKAVSVELPEGIGRDSDRLGDDLRIVDQEGREVPYVLRSDRAVPRRVPATPINSVIRAGEQSLEIDPPAGAVVAGIELDIDTPLFSRQCEILSAAPGDAAFSPVFREGVLHRGKEGNAITALDFPPQEGRRLRLVVRGNGEPLAIRGIRLRVAAETPGRRRSFPAEFLGTDRPDGGSRRSVRFALSSTYPADRIRLFAEPAEFARDARLYREGPAGEALVAAGTLRGRAGYPEGGDQGMAVPPLGRGRYRLEIEEGDSPTLRPSGISLSGPAMFLVFRPASALPHFLFHGRPGAKAPSYDLDRILADSDVASALPVFPGPEKANADFAGERAQKTLPEREPWLVRGAAFLVALLLGGVAWRALNRA